MREGNIINNNYFYFNTKLIDFILINYGLNYFIYKKIMQRFEFNNTTITLKHFNKKWFAVIQFFYKIVPLSRFFSKKNLINKYLLNLINSYRGFRQLMSLPSRGQRTWSNANTIFSSFNSIRNKKMQVFKKYLNNSPESNFYFNLEFFNNFWKNQWTLEWAKANNERLNVDIKKKFDKNFLFLKLKSSKKQMNFSIGFESGFSKNVLTRNINLKKKAVKKKKKK